MSNLKFYGQDLCAVSNDNIQLQGSDLMAMCQCTLYRPALKNSKASDRGKVEGGKGD